MNVSPHCNRFDMALRLLTRWTENKMYSQRTKNIPVFRGCSYSCIYCSFKRLVQMNKKCPACAEFKPHSHMEVLQRTPPRTKEGEFLTVGLAGDVSFMKAPEFLAVVDYCLKYHDRTFLIQSKNPVFFKSFIIPDNMVLGTTIESDRELWWGGTPTHYSSISAAPYPEKRYEAMLELNCRKAVTIEPIMDFSSKLIGWIIAIKPEFCYIGYCNDGKQGKRLKLPEPPLEKTLELITRLQEAGIDVREKTIRKAWWE